MEQIKTAIGDAVLTFMWMFCAATIAPITGVIAEHFKIQSVPVVLGITVLIIAALILIFEPISAAMGNASFNAVNNAAFYAAGVGGDTLFTMAIRFPAQAVGAVGGVLAIKEVMPPQYKSLLGGPSLKVDLHVGAMAEGILTFIITFAVLWIIIKGPSNAILRNLMIALATVAMIFSGGAYTGPSMNPINAYGWAYIDNRHNTWEQFYVYWIPSFIGAILAAWTFRFIFLRTSTKMKKA
ncbi:uncharacterized protein A4U43_C10F5080 [Asparagus officinalis]|uniref:Aquaporin n=1 Tax=Asparagus officinalis TaxID=4686 RepID=A0A5P1E0T1_ASPOF|nr:aquaporin SIP1-2-like [Asparagus officinalis]ONK56192.1 uncharacterized protein A4U43_C10F5080 [Asparagus officinalis]